MEETYTLPDGSTVDISSYSQFQKTNFLIKNPGAKKSKGTAKSATALPKNQALGQSTESKQAGGSSGSKKFRLPTEAEINTQRKKGLMPPPSTIRFSEGEYNADSFEYDLRGNLSKKKNKPLPEYKYGEGYKSKHEETKEVYLASKDNAKVKINKPISTTTKYIQQDIDEAEVPDPFLKDLKIKQLEREKSRTDSELEHPYLYYSSFNQEKPDSFVKDNFNELELEDMGINAQDFDGFLNKNKYKEDFLDKEQRGLFTEGTGVSGYDVELAKELQKKRLLTLYMSNIQSRDITRQVINQDLEINKGLRDKRDIKENIIFDDNKLINYVEKNFPIYTQKLKENEVKSRKIYEEAKTGGTDFWSWNTVEKIGNATWNGFTDRIHQLSATTYEKLGMRDQAEYSRFLADQDAVETPDDRSVGYVGGKETYVDGKKYLVSAKGDVYDADLKIRITDLLEPKSREKIYDSSKYGNSSYIFSPQGVAVGTAAVMGDMIIQAALTRGVGAFAGIATESRIALSVAGKQTQASQLLNSASSALKMIPIKRSTGYAMVSQGALGYSQGFEETLKAARENGINDEEAFALASNAAQRMGVLYATTGVINPQTNLVDNLFTAKNVVKKAIEQYTKTGKKGFIQSIDDVVRNTPRNFVEFVEEGGKEVVQENVQQVGEIALNKITNLEAGKKILNEEYTASDFINTSILSFISSGLISKAKLPNFQQQDSDIDDLTSLSKLAQNKVQFTKTLDGLVDTKVFTIDEANNLKADVDTYSNNINKLRRDISPSAAMPVMRELDKVTKLENQKKSVDKAFHEEIDLEIEGVRNNIRDIVYNDQVKSKNQTIFTAIKKGIVKDLDLKTFSTTAEVKAYLMEELGFDEKSAEFQSNQGGAIIPYEVLAGFSNNPESIKPGQKIIVVNEQKGRESGASEIVQHEFLHGLIHETVKDDPEIQKLLGVALSKELFKLKDIVEAKGTKDNPVPDEFVRRFGKYVEFYDKLQLKERVRYQTFEISKQEYEDKVNQLLGNQWEEVLTLYSDAISNGTVKYDEGTFTRLKDVLRQVLQRLGIKDIKFESGKDVYNFIKDYNKSVETGNFGLAMKKIGNSGAEVNKEKLRQETGIKPFESKLIRRQDDVSTDGIKFSLSERKSSEDIKKDVNKNYDKDKWGAGSALSRDENPAIERVLYDVLSEYDYIIKGKAKVLNFANTPGYNDLDMISETYIQLMPHIRNFNKEFLQKREEFKKELISKGLEPNSAELKQKLEEQDKKGYEGKKGIVKENDDLNAWINSQLVNKMNAAMKSGNVSEEAFTDDIEGEMFKESRIVDGFTGDQSYLEDEGDSVFDSEEDFAQEQNQLAVLLSDPVYRFVDEKGKPIDIETVPFGGFFVTDISDPSIAANIKLRTETDPTKTAELKRELNDLKRGLELQNKQDITFEEKEELKQLKSFKSYDLSTGLMVNTFKALSIQDTPAKIITDEVGREILRSPNIQTLEYRNFKEKLSTTSKTMARRMTFKNGPEIESLMYNEWKLLYDVINHPVDPVTGQSSYASKKLPPRLKETDDKGNFTKIKNITRVRFLQSYYGIDEATRIIKIYGGANVDKELNEFEDPELSEKDGNSLRPTTYFDRRTALMELFGDVLVLQEARRLIRNPEFLDRVAGRNVNLYNELKDDVIRASVLNDMSKGKSDLVKFSLADKKTVKRKPDYTTASPINTLGNDPFYSLKYVELFSSPSELVKFSLTDIEEEAEEPASKFKDFLSRIDFRELNDDDGWILKTLQQSDLQDDNINTKKLHTLRSTSELYDEISDRFDNLFGSLSVTNSENQWIIKEYKDGYIDAMLDRSLTIPEEAFNEPYWSKMKIDESFRKEELLKVQNQQRIALILLSETVNEIDSFEYSMFFKYLLMKDALSNRYYPDGEKGIIKKSIKKSEYRTTIQPIQDYSNLDFVKEIQKDYKYKKNVGIGAIYLAKKMTEVPLDFSKNFIQEVDYRDNLYKFNRGEEQSEINALNKLASYSVKSGYPGSSWCTGSSKFMAANQLKDGDFYIFANKQTKIPTLAVRYVGDNIAEMAGTRDNQDLWKQDFDQVEFAINNLPASNKEIALNQVEIAKRLSKVTGKEIKEIEEEKVLNKLIFSKEINIHFEKDLYQKSRSAFLKLKELALQKVMKAGGSLLELYKTGFNIDENGTSFVTNELDLGTINKIDEFTENVSIKLQYAVDEANDIEFSENVIFPYEYLELNELKKAKILSINGVTSLTIPKLTEAELLSVDFDKLVEEQSAISLPSKTNYNIDFQFSDNDQDEISEFLVFDKDIDMSDFDLGLYFNELEMEGINLSNVQNAKEISISAAFVDYIYLSKKIKTLSTENLYGKSTSSIEVQGVEEIDTLKMEWANFDGILFEDLKKIGTVEITLRDEYDDDLEDIIRGSEVFRLADNVFFTFEDYESSNFKTKTLKSKSLPSVKFSLAEENNGKLNPLLKGLPFSKQWIVARDIDNAINKGRAAEGIRIPFSVPSRSKFSDEETAYFIIQKVAEGFNDFEFRVKKNAKGPLTKQVLDALDVKSKEYQNRAERNNNIEKTINDFIEENKGVASSETFSPETAKNIGKNIGKYEMYLPPEDEDFLGLLYTLAGAKGKKGDEQLKFLTDTLLKPYSDAMLNLMKARQTMYKDWQDLINKKHKGISKLLKQDSGYGGYLVDQAVRVYLWSTAGYDIPGLDKKDLFHLREIVRTNPKLRTFAADVSLLSKQANGYTEPDSNWGFGSVVSDINGVISKSNRKKYLEQWQNNIDKAFSKDNLSKIEAVYGRKYVKALRNTLDRMKTGSNRAEGSNDSFLNWLNGATAVTMFTNIRSAFLQTLGAVNYLNTSDNNIVKAGAALLNVPQFLKDFNTIWNSDYSKDRRSGLTNDIAEAELAQVMNDPRNKSVIDKFKAANYWILKKGYGPTRFADSFAIAFGGATFYRNRLDAYTKKGMSEADAEKETMRDFYEISESSQQSADVSKISMNQASTKGRLLLSFLNTPFQYSRIIKRSVIDLAKGRGDVANNIAKIVYYSTIQNIMFNFLQNALFSIIWDDDDERDEAGNGKFDKAKIRAVSGSLDTLLRGSGLQGVIISTVKNIIIKWYEKSGDPKGYGDVLLEAANLAPSIGIKARALAKSYKAVEYNKDEIKYKGFSLDNTYALEALTSLTSAATNVPVDRLMQKFENVSNALNEEYEAWQRVAFAMGYNKWNLGISDEKNVSTNAAGELKIPELKQAELKMPELK